MAQKDGKALYKVPVFVYVKAMTKTDAKRIVDAGLSMVARELPTGVEGIVQCQTEPSGADDGTQGS
jgi:hypothetical protein